MEEKEIWNYINYEFWIPNTWKNIQKMTSITEEQESISEEEKEIKNEELNIENSCNTRMIKITVSTLLIIIK